MKKHNYIIFLFLIFSFYACNDKKSNKQKSNIKNHEIEHSFKTVAVLKENLKQIGKIIAFDMIDSERFAITTISGDVFIYDLEGNQINYFNNKGNGPSEYSEPTFIKYNLDKLYIWDSFSLSIDSYDLNGEAIETYGPFASAIGDFAVSGNNLIFYIAGGKPDLVALYDLSEKEITKYLGTPSEEHYLLNLNKGAGGLAITGNKLAYLSADNLDFNLYDFDTAEAKTVIVDDSDFYNEEITNAIAIINNNRPLAVQYLMRNSYVKGLYAVGQNFAVIAEVGTMQMEANKLNTDQRFDSSYVGLSYG